MKTQRVISGIFLVVWFFVLLVGIEMYAGIVAQKVPGYPTFWQLAFYVFLPIFLIVSDFAIIIYKKKVNKLLLLFISIMQFIMFPVFFFLGSGGI
jgi:hypothetical protein